MAQGRNPYKRDRVGQPPRTRLCPSAEPRPGSSVLRDRQFDHQAELLGLIRYLATPTRGLHVAQGRVYRGFPKPVGSAKKCPYNPYKRDRVGHFPRTRFCSSAEPRPGSFLIRGRKFDRQVEKLGLNRYLATPTRPVGSAKKCPYNPYKRDRVGHFSPNEILPFGGTSSGFLSAQRQKVRPSIREARLEWYLLDSHKIKM
ncbi:unnamed protein product [Acanthosepion pharaonis]|uniref:Uncharacterized protein n=1 Tax=Acanthosepion pharaonis TaxID=158019 RepID=A0A812B6J6_ACAPH|nr:unnamed protein product [Sepia pharaonis]